MTAGPTFPNDKLKGTGVGQLIPKLMRLVDTLSTPTETDLLNIRPEQHKEGQLDKGKS